MPRALIRAQADIDANPEKYQHHLLNEVPDRFMDMVDVRRFGVGERVVPQPYTELMFEQAQKWMHERDLFDIGAQAGVAYQDAVHR